MTKTAYVVCKGWYSDRSIIRVYLDQEEADKFVALHNKRAKEDYDQYDIEEHDIADEVWIEEKEEGKEPGFVAFRGTSSFLTMNPGEISVNTWGWDEGDPVMEVFTEIGSFKEEYPVINIPFADAEDDPDIARNIAAFAFEKWDETKTPTPLE
jgi:hypothetical protein